MASTRLCFRVVAHCVNFLALISWGGSQSAFAQAAKHSLSVEARHVSGEFIVKVRSRQMLEKALTSACQSLGVFSNREPLLEEKEGLWFHVKIPVRDAYLSQEKLSRSLQENSCDELLAIEPNSILRAAMSHSRFISEGILAEPDFTQAPELPIPSIDDPNIHKVYGLHKIGAPSVWRGGEVGNTSIIIASIDSGIDYTHEDLVNNLWKNPKERAGNGIDDDGNGLIDDVIGWDFQGNDARPFDEMGHGTHAMGVVAATGGNGIGISGVAQKSSIMPLRFLAKNGTGTLENALLAIRYAVENGAQILSTNWNSPFYSRSLFEAVQNAASRGIFFVTAAGNESSDLEQKPLYPKGFKLENVITVAATNEDDELVASSNYGRQSVHIAAPGVKILSTLPRGKYAYLSGTSMASSHVAGAIALLKSAYPRLSMAEIKDLLERGADRLANLNDKIVWGGRLNIEKAFLLAQEQHGAMVNEKSEVDAQ
jgi:subtilisin family serine protease